MKSMTAGKWLAVGLVIVGLNILLAVVNLVSNWGNADTRWGWGVAIAAWITCGLQEVSHYWLRRVADGYKGLYFLERFRREGREASR